MEFVDGLISDFLSLLGVELTTITGHYIAFCVTGTLIGVLAVCTMVFLFRLIVFIRKG